MYEIKIQRTRDHEQTLQFVGWRDDRRSFYASDGKQKLLFELETNYPDNVVTGQPFQFPSVRPIAIVPARLMPPECVATQIEAKEFHTDALYPTPEDELALIDFFKSYQEKARAYVWTNKTKTQLIWVYELFKPFEILKELLNKEKILPQEDIDRAEANFARQVVEQFRQNSTATIEGLKLGKTPILKRVRDRYLVEKWAKRTGSDLDAMKNTAAYFATQWVQAFGDPYLIARHPPLKLSYRAEHSIGRFPSAVLPIGRLFPREWLQIADRSAMGVRFELRCIDGQKFFIRNFNFRDHFTPAEAAELKMLSAPIELSQKENVGDAQPTPLGLDAQFENKPKYAIEFRGAHYDIIFNGKAFSAPDDAGMRYLVAFIRNHDKNKDARYLMTEAWGSTLDRNNFSSGSDVVPDDEKKSLRSSDQIKASEIVNKMREMLRRRAQLEQYEQNPDDPESEWHPSTQAELNDLRKAMGDDKAFRKELLKQLAIATGKKVSVPDDNRKAQQAMQRALNRTLKKMEPPPRISREAEEARAAFVEHINERLMRGFMKECYYQQPSGVNWVLRC